MNLLRFNSDINIPEAQEFYVWCSSSEDYLFHYAYVGLEVKCHGQNL